MEAASQLHHACSVILAYIHSYTLALQSTLSKHNPEDCKTVLTYGTLIRNGSDCKQNVVFLWKAYLPKLVKTNVTERITVCEIILCVSFVHITQTERMT
jgi:hypothetical protein